MDQRRERGHRGGVRRGVQPLVQRRPRPEILACPGWHANRRYECLDGEPRFLAVYDLEDAERPFNSPEWAAAVGWDDHVDHIRGFHGFRVYELIFDSGSR